MPRIGTDRSSIGRQPSVLSSVGSSEPSSRKNTRERRGFGPEVLDYPVQVLPWAPDVQVVAPEVNSLLDVKPVIIPKLDVEWLWLCGAISKDSGMPMEVVRHLQDVQQRWYADREKIKDQQRDIDVLLWRLELQDTEVRSLQKALHKQKLRNARHLKSIEALAHVALNQAGSQLGIGSRLTVEILNEEQVQKRKARHEALMQRLTRTEIVAMEREDYCVWLYDALEVSKVAEEKAMNSSVNSFIHRRASTRTGSIMVGRPPKEEIAIVVRQTVDELGPSFEKLIQMFNYNQPFVEVANRLHRTVSNAFDMIATSILACRCGEWTRTPSRQFNPPQADKDRVVSLSLEIPSLETISARYNRAKWGGTLQTQLEPRAFSISEESQDAVKKLQDAYAELQGHMITLHQKITTVMATFLNNENPFTASIPESTDAVEQSAVALDVLLMTRNEALVTMVKRDIKQMGRLMAIADRVSNSGPFATVAQVVNVNRKLLEHVDCAEHACAFRPPCPESCNSGSVLLPHNSGIRHESPASGATLKQERDGSTLRARPTVSKPCTPMLPPPEIPTWAPRLPANRPVTPDPPAAHASVSSTQPLQVGAVLNSSAQAPPIQRHAHKTFSSVELWAKTLAINPEDPPVPVPHHAPRAAISINRPRPDGEAQKVSSPLHSHQPNGESVDNKRKPKPATLDPAMLDPSNDKKSKSHFKASSKSSVAASHPKKAPQFPYQYQWYPGGHATGTAAATVAPDLSHHCHPADHRSPSLERRKSAGWLVGRRPVEIWGQTLTGMKVRLLCPQCYTTLCRECRQTQFEYYAFGNPVNAQWEMRQESATQQNALGECNEKIHQGLEVAIQQAKALSELCTAGRQPDVPEMPVSPKASISQAQPSTLTLTPVVLCDAQTVPLRTQLPSSERPPALSEAPAQSDPMSQNQQGRQPKSKRRSHLRQREYISISTACQMAARGETHSGQARRSCSPLNHSPKSKAPPTSTNAVTHACTSASRTSTPSQHHRQKVVADKPATPSLTVAERRQQRLDRFQQLLTTYGNEMYGTNMMTEESIIIDEGGDDGERDADDDESSSDGESVLLSSMRVPSTLR